MGLTCTHSDAPNSLHREPSPQHSLVHLASLPPLHYGARKFFLYSIHSTTESHEVLVTKPLWEVVPSSKRWRTVHSSALSLGMVGKRGKEREVVVERRISRNLHILMSYVKNVRLRLILCSMRNLLHIQLV